MNREVSKLDHRIEKLHGKLQSVQEKLETDLYNPLLIKEEKGYLEKKSRATWLMQGDSNTKFFYAQLKAR